MSGGQYAANTTVPVGRSRDEIERTLTRYGAAGFAFAQDQTAAAVSFLLRGRHLRFAIPLPQPDARAYTHSPRGQARTKAASEELWQKAVRARWRALGLIIKAKLEAVDAGVVEFDTEFMSQMVLPDGRTVGQAMEPYIDNAIATGAVPAILPGSGS